MEQANNREIINPIFTPSKEYIEKTNIYKIMQEQSFGSYENFHTWSYKYYSEYWQSIIDKLKIKFKVKYNKICDSKNIEAPNWLIGAKLNIIDSCFNVTDKSKPAIIWQQENSDEINKISYKNLESLCNKISLSLINLNLEKNSSIAIDMPMTIEAIAIYLGIIKAGHKVVSIADSFAPEEIATRLEIANAKLIFTQDYIIRSSKKLPLYEKVVAANAPKAIVLPSSKESYVKLRNNDLAWSKFLTEKEKNFASKECEPHSHINILFSSGTTSTPKAIPWDHTSAIKSAADGYLHQDIKPEDIVAWPTNLGWMMGPWLIFATLINRATISLYYGTPNTQKFAKFIQDSKTTILGLVPSIVKTWRQNNTLENINWSNIKLFSSTGEASNPNDMTWLSEKAHNKPIIEYCGGTEISGGYITSTVVQPNYASCFSTKALGLNFYLIDENGNETNNGEVALVPPSIGLSKELLNKDHHESYYANMPKINEFTLRRHGDQIEQLENGHFRALGRADDAMNLGGIKVSSAEIERTLNTIPNITETAAIAVAPKSGGPSNLVIYAVTEKNLVKDNKKIKEDMQHQIKTKLNPLFKIHDVVLIETLPRTSSNKIMRRALRSNYKDKILDLR